MKTDTEMLDWMIFHAAHVCCSKDGDDCWVKWPDDEDGYNETKIHHDFREAIQDAMG